MGCKKHPQPEGNRKCPLQLLNTSWSVKLSYSALLFSSVNVCFPRSVSELFCVFSTASSTGLIYIDPTNLRRSSAISSSAAAAAAALEASNSSSYLTSASSLARAYSIVIRQISDLMSLIPKYNHLVYSQYPAAVKLTYQDAVNLQVRWSVINVDCTPPRHQITGVKYTCLYYYLLKTNTLFKVVADWCISIEWIKRGNVCWNRTMLKKSWFPPGTGWCPSWIPLKLSCDMAQPYHLLETRVTPVTHSMPLSTQLAGNAWLLEMKPASAPWKDAGKRN